jgi:hypothetical protein
VLRRTSIQQRLHRIRTDDSLDEHISTDAFVGRRVKLPANVHSNSNSPRRMHCGEHMPNHHAGSDVKQADNNVMHYTQSLLRSNWSKFQGHACVGVEWKRADHGLEDLARVCRCVKGPVLAAVCEKLASDYALWRHGLPDLLFVRESRLSRDEQDLIGSCGNGKNSTCTGCVSSQCTSRGGSSMTVDMDTSTVRFETSSDCGHTVGTGAGCRKHSIKVDVNVSREHHVVIDSDDCEVEASVSGNKKDRGSEESNAAVGGRCYRGEALLVEVKGTGDSLSNAQIAWIHVLMRAGAQLEVCHVTR